ncbi:MAG: hypothetical protein ACJ72Q_15145 [Nitrososphaeraceae archaeon]|jgi:hypothetical protein
MNNISKLATRRVGSILNELNGANTISSATASTMIVIESQGKM